MGSLSPDRPTLSSRRWGMLPRVLALTALATAVGLGGAAAPLGAQAAAEQAADVGLLQGEALSAAEAACRAGIAAGQAVGPGAAAVDPITGAVGKWVLGLLAGHIKGVAQRRLGMDREYNRFLTLSQQMRDIDRQLRALDERIQNLAAQIHKNELRDARRRFADLFGNPVRNGSQSLTAVMCKEAAVAKLEDGERKKQAEIDRDFAVDDFKSRCGAHKNYQDVAVNMTQDFRSEESILEVYLRAAIRPRRYLTHQDSLELDNFFYGYYLNQVQALRLASECQVRFPPPNVRNDTEEAFNRLVEVVLNRIYVDPLGTFHGASLGTLPNIMPALLPEGVVLDLETDLLWWNGTYVGPHPHVLHSGSISTDNGQALIPLDHRLEGPKGPWKLELAKFAEIEKLAQLNAPMPPARRAGARYADTLVGFLKQIGLGHVAEKVASPPSRLGFVWASDFGIPILRCSSPLVSGEQLCNRWDDPHNPLGYSAAAALANGPSLRVQPGNGILYAPQGCPPEECRRGRDSYKVRLPNTITLCQTHNSDYPRNRCIRDGVLGQWQAPGIYRAAQLRGDRFFRIDLSVLN